MQTTNSAASLISGRVSSTGDRMKVKMLRQKFVAGQSCAVGDVVECEEKDARYLINRGFAEESVEKPKAARAKKADDVSE